MTAALQLAQQRAQALYPRSKQFRSAYLAGARARLAGRRPGDCPYRPDARNTWRTAFRKAWLAGHAGD